MCTQLLGVVQESYSKMVQPSTVAMQVRKCVDSIMVGISKLSGHNVMVSASLCLFMKKKYVVANMLHLNSVLESVGKYRISLEYFPPVL